VQSYAQLPPEQSFLGQNELNSRQKLKNGCLAVFLGLVFIRSGNYKKAISGFEFEFGFVFDFVFELVFSVFV
jgi:hypothetical protein